MLASLLTAILLAAADGDAVEARLSEAPVDLDAAWEELGFRMQLGAGYERTRDPFGEQDRWGAISLHVEPGARLSPRWSVSMPIEYAVAIRSPYDGLRWTTLAQLAWHPSTGSYVAVAAGYGGMIMSGQDEFGGFVEAPPTAEEEPGLGDVAGGGVTIRRDCTGDGLVTQLRLGQLWHRGELFATGPMLTGQAHWTRCDREDQFDFEGNPLGEARWLMQITLGASWMFAWR